MQTIHAIGLAGLIGLAVFSAAMLPAYAQYEAFDVNATTTTNQAVQIQLDGTGPDPVYFVIDTQPANGVLSNLDNVTGIVTYTPNSGFVGSDAFSYETQSQANATWAGDRIGVVTIAVNQPVGGRAAYFATVNAIAANLAALDGGTIPEDNSVTMYDLHVLNGVLFASMDAVDAAFGMGSWNDLTEGQQVWIVLHFNELVSAGGTS